MTSDQALRETATAFIGAFTDLDPEKHTSLRTPDCTHIFGPASLDPPPPKSNADFAAHLVKLHNVLSGFPVTAKEIHVNEPKRQVVCWCTAVPEFKSEVKSGLPEEEWEYTGEYIFILDMDQSGKIKRIVEFLDSKATERLKGLMAKAMENAGGFKLF